MALRKLLEQPGTGAEVEYWKIVEVNLALPAATDAPGLTIEFELWGFRDDARRRADKAPMVRDRYSVTHADLGVGGTTTLNGLVAALYGWLKAAQPAFADAASV